MTEYRRSKLNWILPVVGAVGCLALGTASGLSTVGGDDSWYRAIVKPPGTPPGWVFGPVWSILYLMMGIALGRLIVRRAWPAVWVFAMQMVLNLVWTPVFFGLHQIAVALAVIGALWFGVLATILFSRKVDGISAWLLTPYLIWVTYASYLNAGLLWLNR